eukprot:COSAG05_NODE_1163_length_5656_cov_2.387979_6_plen_174_part_00
MHWPCAHMEDSILTYKAMEAAVVSGQVRTLGVSNFNATALEALMEAVSIPPAVNQCGFSISGHNSPLYGRDDATRKHCAEVNVTYSAYSPLGGWTEHGTAHILHDPTVLAVARAHNKSAAQIALRWVVQQGIVAVTGSTKAAYDIEDLGVFSFALSTAEMAALAAVRAGTDAL